MGSKLDMGHKSTIQKVSQGAGGRIEKKRLEGWGREGSGRRQRVVAGSSLPSLAKVQVGDAAPFGA